MTLSRIFGSSNLPSKGQYDKLVDSIDVARMHALLKPESLHKRLQILIGYLNEERAIYYKPKITAEAEYGIDDFTAFMRLKLNAPIKLGEILPGLERAVAMSHDPDSFIAGKNVLKDRRIVITAENSENASLEKKSGSVFHKMALQPV